MAERVPLERLALVVMWSRRRHPLGLRFGVLIIDGRSVRLSDRDGAILMDLAGPDVLVTTLGRLRLGLSSAGAKPLYVEGPYAQLTRNRRARELMEANDARVVPPRTYPMSDRAWGRLTRGTSPYAAPFNRMSQALIWRNVMLQHLWNAGARQDDSAPG
ncbi:MAG: hypothetical protein ABSE52_02165 [Candidatus Dormibacteria bacterium]